MSLFSPGQPTVRRDRPPCCHRSWPGRHSAMCRTRRSAPSVGSNRQAASHKRSSHRHLRIPWSRSNYRPGLGSTPRYPAPGTRCTDCRPLPSRRRSASLHNRRPRRSRPPERPPRPRPKSDFSKDSASLPFSNMHRCSLSGEAAISATFVTSGVLYCARGCRVRVKMRTLPAAAEDAPLSSGDDVRHKRGRVTWFKIL